MITKLSECLSDLLDVSATFPMAYALVFLEIAEDEGLVQSELIDRCKSTRTAVSRAVTALGEWERKGVPGLKDRPGMGLVQSEIDPGDRRMRRLWLTPKGKRLIKHLETRLAG